MFHYLRGLLVHNEHGAKAPGSSRPVDRWLVIQTLGGIRIRAFDYKYLPEENILLSEREGIREGTTYTFLLIVLANTVERSENATHPWHEAERWQGTVIAPRWVLPQQTYLAVDPQDVGNYRGLLVETTIGQVIISRQQLGVNKHGEVLPHPLTFRQGDGVRWDHIRWSLLAILAESETP